MGLPEKINYGLTGRFNYGPPGRFNRSMCELHAEIDAFPIAEKIDMKELHHTCSSIAVERSDESIQAFLDEN